MSNSFFIAFKGDVGYLFDILLLVLFADNYPLNSEIVIFIIFGGLAGFKC